MKTLIICKSKGATQKIAETMQEALDADLVTPENSPSVYDYDLIGLGSGIYNKKHTQSILNIAKDISDKNIFIFSTNPLGTTKNHEDLKKIIQENGNSLIGEFACKKQSKLSFITLNKTRPNEKDLEKAKEFASSLKVYES